MVGKVSPMKYALQLSILRADVITNVAEDPRISRAAV